MATRQQERRSAASARSGAGPTTEQPGGRWPGASQKFALFGEVMQVGIIVTVLSLPLVTIPLALAVGQRHLERFLHAEGSSLDALWADVRAALPGALVTGLGWLVLTAALVLDALLASSGAVPGGAFFSAAGIVGLLLSSVALVRVTGTWTPQLGWRGAFRAWGGVAFRDLSGSVFLAVAVALTALFTWMLPPLVLPALGCLCFAGAVIAARQRARASGAAA